MKSSDTCSFPFIKVTRKSFTYLHNKKVRIINIKLNWSKQVLYSGVVSIASIDQILVSSSNHNLEFRHTLLLDPHDL